MNRMPESVRDMSLMANAERKYQKVSEVHAVQAQIAEWIVEAGYARYGHLFDAFTLTEIHEKCWENALVQWPGINTLVEALNAAERATWTEEGAAA